MLMAVAAAASLHGRLVFDNAPLPGVTVTLQGMQLSTVTDAQGHYTFANVPPGSYEIAFELSRFEPKQKRVALGSGVNELGAEALVLREIEVVIVCGARACADDPPKDQWDLPGCDEYNLDVALQQAMRNGDRSAAELLQRRYETTSTVAERIRIGGMLLRHVSDDSAYWKDLARMAEDAVRFAERDDATQAKFAAYCADRGLDADGYEWVMYQAFTAVSGDIRSRALLLRALGSSDPGVVFGAIAGLGAQHDLESLEAIERALGRMESDSHALALALAEFDDDAADAIAMKYLGEERQEYLAARRIAHAAREAR